MSEEIPREQLSTLHIRISKPDTVIEIDVQLEPSSIAEVLRVLCGGGINSIAEPFITPRLQTSLDPDLLDIPVGKIIKSWREHLGLKQTELASSASISKGYLSQIEHGRIQLPNSAILRKLSAALRISPWDLIHRQYPDSNQ